MDEARALIGPWTRAEIEPPFDQRFERATPRVGIEQKRVKRHIVVPPARIDSLFQQLERDGFQIARSFREIGIFEREAHARHCY